MKNINVNKEELVDEILSRGISLIYPDKESLKKILLSQKKLKIYIGADPSGKDLHLGHLKNFILLEKFRRLGHKIIVLFGDFTAMIGDPTGKSKTRIALNKKEIGSNLKTWKKQLSPIIQFKKIFNRPTIVKNSTWLSKLSFDDVVSLSSNFTVQQMIERDMFEERLKKNEPIYLHEFLYPLMQGYDSVALDVDVEIGGTDQTFNMLAGRTLLKKYKNKDKFVITTELIVDSATGKKMSKSENNYVSLNNTADNMFGEIMALSDGLIFPLFRDCTFVSNSELEEVKEILNKKEDLKNLKVRLAKEIVGMYFGENKAVLASKNFDKTFSKKEVPENIKEVFVLENELLSDVLLKEKIISSKADFVRLIKEGAVSELTKNERLTDFRIKALPGVYKIGKHRFLKIKF